MKSRILPALIFLLVASTGGYAVWRLWPESSDSAAIPEAAAEPASPSVVLGEEKLRQMDLETAPAVLRVLQQRLTVPGRVQYDDARHVEVRAAAAGVLTEVRVKPGDRVEAGDVLAVVSSPEVGAARADLLQRNAELELARQMRDWTAEKCAGAERLTQAVADNATLPEIREQFRDDRLGAVREQILTAYSQHLLAKRLADSLTSASGAVSGKTLQEAVTERDKSAAAMDAVLEQALFDVRRECQQATNAAADAERRAQIARQHLRTLLGFIDEPAPGDMDPDPDADLSLVEVRAPFAGTIERKAFSAAERVQQGDSLFVLADTSRLWISASLREREWSASQLRPGAELEVVFPAANGKRLSATVHYVGREVDPQTNALPLVALIENPDGDLRPGMFAMITLPAGEERTALAVPVSAVSEHQGSRFVFRCIDERAFEPVDIVTGLEEGEWIEVKEGLQAGDPVVVAGVFQLKSELLLEREE